MSANKRQITLFLCGNVMIGRGIDQVLPCPSDPRLEEPNVGSALDYVAMAEAANGPIARPVAFSDVWGAALDAFERVRPDARIINLETSVTTSKELEPKGINYRMNPANVPCLSAAGIDCCVLANNHVLDWGETGLRETLKTLGRANLATVGAGLNADGAEAPVIIEIGPETRIIVFAMGTETSGIPRAWAAQTNRPGVNLLTDLSERTSDRIATAVRAVKRAGDIVVASIHWGDNWGYDISREQRAFAHRLIDEAHVNVVHGHSSHHLKAIEVYKDKPILYGCGDFLNDYEGIGGYERFRDDLVLMYFPTIEISSGRLVRLQMTPLQIRNFRLQRPSNSNVEWLRDTLTGEGSAFGTTVSRAADRSLKLLWRETTL